MSPYSPPSYALKLDRIELLWPFGCVYCYTSDLKHFTANLYLPYPGSFYKLRWLQIVRVWLLVRFSVFPLIYSCAGNTCGKLVKGCDKVVKGRGKLFKGRGKVVKGHADRSLHLGKTLRITERLFNPWPSNFVTITCNKYATILRLQIFDSLFCLVMAIFR